MGVKFKSKTHLLNTFYFIFGAVFARLASKFEKSTNMTYDVFVNNFFEHCF